MDPTAPPSLRADTPGPAACAAGAIADGMHQALQMAQQALYRSAPNPRVGCVICDAQGAVLGRGATQLAGGPHAEIMALRDARERGHALAGATAYVTLEPCSHHGRTGPCCDALIDAGIAKVVASLIDPNPLVSGQGLARLHAASVQVEVGAGAEVARALNIGFFSRMLRQTPWVRMKVAASLDGVTALRNGASQWLTGPAARADGHAWRARACALLTGIGTVLADDPRLDVRALPTDRQPALVLVDSRLQVPPEAALFKPRRAVLVYAAADDAAKRRMLEERGATLLVLPDGQGQVDLAAMLRDLGRRQINELHVEAGHQLNGALLRAKLVDELLLYLAPKLLGDGLRIAQTPALTALSQAQTLHFDSIERIGDDLRILARLPGRDGF